MISVNPAVRWVAQRPPDSTGGLFQIVYLCNAAYILFKPSMFKKLTDEIRELSLPKGSFAIFGSGPMAIRGLKEPNDIDLIVTKDVYELLKNKHGWDEKIYNESEKHYLTVNNEMHFGTHAKEPAGGRKISKYSTQRKPETKTNRRYRTMINTNDQAMRYAVTAAR